MAKSCKFQIEKEQQSNDCGQVWTDTGNSRKIAGQDPVDKYSPDCGWSDSFMFEWFTVSDEYICNGYDKYTKKMQRVSYNLGEDWEVVPGSETIGTLVEKFSPDCCQIRTVSGETCDELFRKVNASIEEASLDGEVWVQTGNYTINSVISKYSPECIPDDVKFLGIPINGATGTSYFDYRLFDKPHYGDQPGAEAKYKSSNYTIVGCDRHDDFGYFDYGDSGLIEHIYVNNCAHNPSFKRSERSSVTLKVLHLAKGVSGILGGLFSPNSGRYEPPFSGFGNLEDIEGLGDCQITYIMDAMFMGCTSLRRVTIPATCTGLGGGVFKDCTGLWRVTFKTTSLTDGGTNQFDGCTNLRTVTFPSDYEGVIYSSMFTGCDMLENVTLGNPTGIGSYAFNECNSLTEIHLGNRLKYLSPNVFRKCIHLTDVYITSLEDVSDIYNTTFPDQCIFHVLQEKYDYWNGLFPGRVTVISE